MTDLGPNRRVIWIEGDERRVRAKQLRMLEVDEEAMAEWLKFMRDLVAEGLSDEDFTLRRMSRLKTWQKSRKLAQARLHYQFDPRRRKPSFVDRDVARQLQRARTVLEQRQGQLASRLAPTPELETVTPRKSAVKPSVPSQTRNLDGVRPSVIAMIANDTGIRDLSTATDEDIIDGYKELGLSPTEAQIYIAMLNPTLS